LPLSSKPSPEIPNDWVLFTSGASEANNPSFLSSVTRSLLQYLTKSFAGSEAIKSNLLQKDGADVPAGLHFRIPAFLFKRLACWQVALTLKSVRVLTVKLTVC